jgi:hypothetical protein
MANNKERKKKERERRVAQKKIAARKKVQEKSAKEEEKPFPQTKRTFPVAPRPQAQYVPANKKSPFTQRRSGGG